MIYRRRKKDTRDIGFIHDAYRVKVDRDWVTLASMELEDKRFNPDWITKYRLSPFLEKQVMEHFNMVPEYHAGLIFDEAQIKCDIGLLEFILRLQGFVHAMSIQRYQAEYYYDLVEELGAEEETAVIIKTLTGLILSKNKETNTLLAIREPSGILTSDLYQRVNDESEPTR